MLWIRSAFAVAIIAPLLFCAVLVARGLGGMWAVLIVQLGSLCGIVWFLLDMFLILIRGNPFRVRAAWLGLVVDAVGMLLLATMLVWVGRALMSSTHAHARDQLSPRRRLTTRSSELPGAGESSAVDVVTESFVFLSGLPLLVGSRSPWTRSAAI